MSKRLVLLISLLALIFCVASIQTKNGTSAQLKESTDSGKHMISDSLLVWMTNLKNESQVLRDQGDIQLAVQKLSRAIELRWREPVTNEEYEKLAWIYTNRAYLYHERQGDFLAAKEDYLSALRQFESCEPSDYLVARYVYQPLGNIYTRLGENEIAISMLEKFKRECEENGETEALMNAYNDIGRAYMNSWKLEEAIEWFTRGIQIDETDHFNLGLLYSSKAEAEGKNGNPEAGFISAEKSLRNLDRVIAGTKETDFHHTAAQRYKVGVYATMGKSIDAMDSFSSHEYYRKAVKLAMELYPNKHRGLARTFVDLGSSWTSHNDQRKALLTYQLGLNAMFDSINLDDFTQNPRKSELYADVVIGEALIQKARAAHSLFDQVDSLQWLETAVYTYLTYFDWVEIQRAEQFEFNSKLGTASEIHQIGESALEAFFDMYQKTKDARWIDTAFIVMDQTKAIVLAEERGYKNLAEKNPELRSKLKMQNALKFQRSKFEADFKGIEENGVNSDEVLRLKKRLSEIDKESQLLDQDIRALFPSYRTEESSKLEGKALTRLTEKLKKKDASILSFFVGDLAVYAITGSPNDFNFRRFSLDSVTSNARSFLNELIAPNATTAQKYGNAAKSLFDVLVGDEANELKSTWVILPDGLLNGLPFEAMVSSSRVKSFKNLDYLIRKYIIQYAPSAFFFAHENIREQAPESFLGMAPMFANSKTFDFLPKSKEELTSGTSFFSGVELTNFNATKDEFFKKAEQFDILHISTHAGTNSGTNNDAWMVFSDEKSSDYKLEANELLKLDLPASLVVLNACETGSGTVLKGEGPMSLSRGFLNAGAESTVTNLWSVNHESNAAIMSSFYESLSETRSPSKSLSEAKLAYLSSGEIDDMSAHPYYWSAPILIGSDAEVNKPNSLLPANFLLIALGAIVTLVISITFIRRRMKRGVV